MDTNWIGASRATGGKTQVASLPFHSNPSPFNAQLHPTVLSAAEKLQVLVQAICVLHPGVEGFVFRVRA